MSRSLKKGPFIDSSLANKIEERNRQGDRKIINIHPSLLPAFKGNSAIKDAWEYGAKVTGVTVHYVDEGMDTGQIIAQKAIRITGNDTLKSLEKKIHKVEHKMYPQVIGQMLTGFWPNGIY